MPSVEARKQMAMQYDTLVTGSDGATAAAAMTKMAANIMNTAADLMATDSGTPGAVRTTTDVAETGVSGAQAASQLFPSGVSQVCDSHCTGPSSWAIRSPLLSHSFHHGGCCLSLNLPSGSWVEPVC